MFAPFLENTLQDTLRQRHQKCVTEQAVDQHGNDQCQDRREEPLPVFLPLQDIELGEEEQEAGDQESQMVHQGDEQGQCRKHENDLAVGLPECLPGFRKGLLFRHISVFLCTPHGPQTSDDQDHTQQEQQSAPELRHRGRIQPGGSQHLHNFDLGRHHEVPGGKCTEQDAAEQIVSA